MPRETCKFPAKFYHLPRHGWYTAVGKDLVKIGPMLVVHTQERKVVLYNTLPTDRTKLALTEKEPPLHWKPIEPAPWLLEVVRNARRDV